jgi:hypothetical protein
MTPVVSLVKEIIMENIRPAQGEIGLIYAFENDKALALLERM